MAQTRLSLVLALSIACGSAAHADTWQVGGLTTYIQNSWGGDPANDAGAALLNASFDTVYGATFGVTVGSTSGFTMSFTDADSVRADLPSIGPFAALNGTTLNPVSTASGAFGGEVLSLEFNVDFSDAGLLPASSGLRFGDLILENFATLPALNGLTVREFLADANTCLGGGACLYNPSDLDFENAFVSLNAAFADGTPIPFAQAHLVAPTSAGAVPEPSSWLFLIPAVALEWGRRLRCR